MKDLQERAVMSVEETDHERERERDEAGLRVSTTLIECARTRSVAEILQSGGGSSLTMVEH